MTKNIFYRGDCLYVLGGLNSESVDLVYADPPYKFKRTYSAFIGTKRGSVAEWTFHDVDGECLAPVEDIPALLAYLGLLRIMHSNRMAAYVTFMAQRIIQMHRVLKDTGCIYLHLADDVAPHIKPVLDIVFGSDNFVSSVVWRRRNGGADLAYNRVHDTILYYAKSSKHKPRKVKGVKTASIIDIHGLMPWCAERTGYPEQKPIQLVDILIRKSSDEGDVVLDAFAGNGTTSVAAQRLGRRWIAIDMEMQANEMLIRRLSDETSEWVDYVCTDRIPHRSDVKEFKLDDSKLAKEIMHNQDGKCAGCGKQDVPLTMGRKTPISKGGTRGKDNIDMRCERCTRDYDTTLDKITEYKP